MAAPRQSGSRSAFVLAHLSDPHLSSPAGSGFVPLLNKRILGYLAWRYHHRHVNCPHILAAMLRDLAVAAPDHVVVTGDITYLGLPHELREASLWLRRLGPPERVTLVLGNHDAYVAKAWQEAQRAWAPYLAGDCQAMAAASLPAVRVRGPLALIGLSSARPSAPFLAVGSLGDDQLEHFAAALAAAHRRGLLRIVLLHHSPVPGGIAWHKRLTDAHRFLDVLGRQGAELILHGHAHVTQVRELYAGTRTIPIFGVAAASDSRPDPQYTARYHLYRFEREANGWMLTVTARSFCPAQGRFTMLQQWHLPLPVTLP